MRGQHERGGLGLLVLGDVLARRVEGAFLVGSIFLPLTAKGICDRHTSGGHLLGGLPALTHEELLFRGGSGLWLRAASTDDCPDTLLLSLLGNFFAEIDSRSVEIDPEGGVLLSAGLGEIDDDALLFGRDFHDSSGLSGSGSGDDGQRRGDALTAILDVLERGIDESIDFVSELFARSFWRNCRRVFVPNYLPIVVHSSPVSAGR